MIHQLSLCKTKPSKYYSKYIWPNDYFNDKLCKLSMWKTVKPSYNCIFLTIIVPPIAFLEPILNHIWVPEALIRPQKGLNIKLNCKFSQPYSLLGSFLTKTNGFLTRWKIMWVDCHVPTIVFVYENTFWTISVLLRH